jgi:hypothetical protein
MSAAFRQIADGLRFQNPALPPSLAESCAISALSADRGAEQPDAPRALFVTHDLPFAAPSDRLIECRPPWMHLYLGGSAACVCGERR